MQQDYSTSGLLPMLLIREREGQRNIPFPSDIGLESFINFFVRYAGCYDESEYTFIGEIKRNPVKHFAREIVYNLEMSEKVIKNNQEILNYFMQNTKLAGFINHFRNLSAEPKLNKDTMCSKIFFFEELMRRIKSYINYTNKLCNLWGDSENKQIKLYGKALERLRSGPLSQLDQLLTEIEAPLNLEISAFCEKAYYDRTNSKCSRSFISFKAIHTKTGEEYEFDNYLGRSDHLIGGDDLLERICILIKNKAEYDPFEKEIAVEAKIFCSKGKDIMIHATCGRLGENWSDGPQYDLFEIEIPTNNDSFYVYGEKLLLEYRTIKYLEKIKKFCPDIKKFENNMLELRYLSMLAKGFNLFEERGYSTKFPIIIEKSKNMTSLENMCAPNLVFNLSQFSNYPFLKNPDLIIANDVFANNEKNVYVITGPNKNGKTTYMDGIAINQALFQAGWKVFAINAAMSPKGKILTQYLRENDAMSGQSLYSSQLESIKELCNQLEPISLVLLDDLCVGTNPNDGAIVAEGILKAIHKTGATVYLSTHYHNLIDTANCLPYADNLHCSSGNDKEEIKYTFRILPGSSYNDKGVNLAEKIGVGPNAINRLIEERALSRGYKLRQ